MRCQLSPDRMLSSDAFLPMRRKLMGTSFPHYT